MMHALLNVLLVNMEKESSSWTLPDEHAEGRPCTSDICTLLDEASASGPSSGLHCLFELPLHPREDETLLTACWKADANREIADISGTIVMAVYRILPG
jgi:hypothetical protein